MSTVAGRVYGYEPGQLLAHTFQQGLRLPGTSGATPLASAEMCIRASATTSNAVHDLFAGTGTTRVAALRPDRWLVVTELAHHFLHTGVGRGLSLSNRLARWRRQHRQWVQGLKRWRVWLSVSHAQVASCVH
jgi:hypothetical protein